MMQLNADAQFVNHDVLHQEREMNVANVCLQLKGAPGAGDDTGPAGAGTCW